LALKWLWMILGGRTLRSQGSGWLGNFSLETIAAFAFGAARREESGARVGALASRLSGPLRWLWSATQHWQAPWS